MGKPTDKFSLEKRIRECAKKEIQSLLTATEQNRILMQKAWQNFENLDAALQATYKVKGDLIRNRRVKELLPAQI
ncbi:MAG TPA: hypothetical protein VNU95_08650 [Candidatus Acidoferrales bacterium]|jgi:hypothetical protein|nr:hypothetical protein [Candidatus Acidoferrales bacterium]